MVTIQEEENAMRCAICKGQTEDRLIRYVQDYKGRLVIIENVPAEVCTQCGEKYIRGDVAKKMQQLVWSRPSPTRSKKVPVYDLAEVADRPALSSIAQ